MRAVYLLDSAILIDHLRGVSKATEWLTALREGEAAISVITRAEVLSHGSTEEVDAATRLCAQFDCLTVTADTADHAAELRRQNRWKLPDAFQAALAIANRVKLVTRNTRDFDPGRHSFVLVPYAL